MIKNDRWSSNQCVLRNDHRTDDNLFILIRYTTSTQFFRKGVWCLAFVDFIFFLTASIGTPTVQAPEIKYNCKCFQFYKIYI